MKFLSEEEAKIARQRLEEEMNIDPCSETRQYTETDINWVEELKNWDEAKIEAKKLCINGQDIRPIFIASCKDRIKGKPQLIHQTLQRIQILRVATKIIKTGRGELYETNSYFIDDHFDKRYDGNLRASLSFDFWVYRLVDAGNEYYLFSRNKLPDTHSEITGMKLHLDDISEMSNNLKVRKISNIFFVKESEPMIKTLDKEKLIEYVKDNNWTEDLFHDYLFCHPSGKIYDYTNEFNMLRKAQMLSSNYEGYGLHVFKMGPVGTGKTTEAECLDYKFIEEQGILEAANSTLKALVPSFKEKPANLGYICRCHRIALIDEMMKMVEEALSKSHDFSRVSNYFGQMNMLLEQKKRTVGSGNDNSAIVNSTAKVSITTNNISRKRTIEEHLGLIDSTTLSRMLVWVQNKEEVSKIYKKDGIREFRTNIHNPPKDFSREVDFIDKSYDSVCDTLRDQFLTIYDSCNNFLVEFNENKCKEIFEFITTRAKDGMKQVWRARGLHHTILILDGVTKHRCLFKDFDYTFTPKEEDYKEVSKILNCMVESWQTNLSKDSWEDILNG